MLARRISRLFPLPTYTGYEHPAVVERIYDKTSRYRPSRFDNCALTNAIQSYHPSTVLDFGGGAGCHFQQAWPYAPDIRWAIVETPKMVERCVNLSAQCNWFHTISDAANWLSSPEFVYSNGALQYTPNPLEIARALAALAPSAALYSRLHFGTGTDLQRSYLSDHGPGEPYGSEAIVRVLRTAIDFDAFIAIHHDYDMHMSGEDILFRRKV